METSSTPLAAVDTSAHRRVRSQIWLVATFGVLVTSIVHADTDVVVTRNGDRLTGEVKSLDRGMLQFDTDATDTIAIRWNLVAQLSSSQNFQIALDDGRELFGSVSASDKSMNLRLTTAGSAMDVPIVAIVRMTPIEGSVIDRIDMRADIGYNVAKANDLSQTTLGYDFGYRSEQRLISLAVDASISESQDFPTSVRSNANFMYRHFLEARQWDPIGLAAIERNDQLGLARRFTVGGGMSRWITDTSRRRISFTGGLVYTSEDEIDVPLSDRSVEAAAGLNVEWFQLEDPEFDVTTQLIVYQRLREEKRTRGNLDVDLRWELIGDLYWGFNLYYSFDSDTANSAASSSDYGIRTSIGWTF